MNELLIHRTTWINIKILCLAQNKWHKRVYIVLFMWNPIMYDRNQEKNGCLETG